MRLTGTERAVAELAAVAEHVASLTSASGALQLRPDVPDVAAASEQRPLIALLDEHTAADAAATLADIRRWTEQELGVRHLPAIWRALAHQPRVLDTTWRKDRLVLSAGTLDERLKTYAALAVAQFRQSDYWIAYYTHVLRARWGLDDRAIVEVAGAVMHYVSFNTVAHAMRLEAPAAEITAADVAAGGRLEQIVPGGRRRPPVAAPGSGDRQA
jgi:alkylhydroperoxidase/carboxymuconolactone decarboxylase family protein YurZ